MRRASRRSPTPCRALGRNPVVGRALRRLTEDSPDVIAPITGRRTRGAPLYGSSKAALRALTRYWAGEYGAQGVRVNEVSPGPTRTEGTAAFGEGLDQLGALTLLKRAASPEEIAGAVVFLALDDAAAYVQGASLGVDGGYHAA